MPLSPSIPTINPSASSADAPSKSVHLHHPHCQQPETSQIPQRFPTMVRIKHRSLTMSSPGHSPCAPRTCCHHSSLSASLTRTQAPSTPLGPLYMFFLLPGMFCHFPPLLSYLHLANSNRAFKSYVKCQFPRGLSQPVIFTKFWVKISPPWTYAHEPSTLHGAWHKASHTGRGYYGFAGPQLAAELPSTHQMPISIWRNRAECNPSQITHRNIHVHLITKRMLSE